jgi:hypothetical protein
VLKTLAKLTFGVAVLAATTSFVTSPSHASGDAPWCAVINIGPGTIYSDCQYPTFEACYHLGNILAGNRGFCNLNPWPGPSQVVPYRHSKHHALRNSCTTIRMSAITPTITKIKIAHSTVSSRSSLRSRISLRS